MTLCFSDWAVGKLEVMLCLDNGRYHWSLFDLLHMKVMKNDLKLKGHCDEDFAVLGQFCAKIITLRGLTIINFSRIFPTRSIKTWKNWPIFSNFNPFASVPSVATGDRKQFQCLQIVFNNKTRSLVLKLPNSVTMPLRV